jgi:hypothetical protein
MIFENNFDLNIVNPHVLAYLYLLGDDGSLGFSLSNDVLHAECSLR